MQKVAERQTTAQRDEKYVIDGVLYRLVEISERWVREREAN